MFAPFEESTFPQTLQPQALQQLLNTPLAARCPIHPTQWLHLKSLGDNIFVEDATRTAPGWQGRLTNALQVNYPVGSPTELLLTGFWAQVGFGLPEYVGTALGFAVTTQRLVCG